MALKLEPGHGQLLRGQHPSVRAGYHMNKEHWNTVTVDAHIDRDELAEWIDESYTLVVERLPRRLKNLSGRMDLADGQPTGGGPA